MIRAEDSKYMYNLIGKNGAIDMSLDEFNKRITGYEDSTRLREELQGQPILSGFLGPMWDGYRYVTPDGMKYEFLASDEEKNTCEKIAVIRYETAAAYEMYSR